MRTQPALRKLTARPRRSRISAWQPAVPGVVEVFHAHFVDHAYPPHTHDAWTLLIVDDGAIRFDLDRHHHGAHGSTVTLLPPGVPHDGRPDTEDGFRKRVVYLDSSVLGPDLAGSAVDGPVLRDTPLRQRIHRLHEVLARPGEALEAESRLAFIHERLHHHLRRRTSDHPRRPGVADQLRELLDERTVRGVTLREAAGLVHAHPTHLVRAFTGTYGLPPHAYLTGRRIDLARRLLLEGHPPAEVATAVGFYDQAHLTRHFTRYLGTSPARYAASSRSHSTDWPVMSAMTS